MRLHVLDMTSERDIIFVVVKTTRITYGACNGPPKTKVNVTQPCFNTPTYIYLYNIINYYNMKLPSLVSSK